MGYCVRERERERKSKAKPLPFVKNTRRNALKLCWWGFYADGNINCRGSWYLELRASGAFTFRRLTRVSLHNDFNHSELRIVSTISIDFEHDRKDAEVLQSVEFEQSPDCR